MDKEREEELKKIAITAKTKVNLDPSAIVLAKRYGDRMQKLDREGHTEEADKIEKEWRIMVKGFIYLVLPKSLSEEEYRKIDEILGF